jgi:hypothetical protein
MTTTLALDLQKDTSSIRKDLSIALFIGGAIGFAGVLTFGLLSNPRPQFRVKRSLSSRFDDLLIHSRRALEDVKSLSPELAKSELRKIKEIIVQANDMRTLLEERNYFKSRTLKEKTTKAVSSLYNIEIELRKKAFKGGTRSGSDANLIDGLAASSQQAIINSITR